MHCENTRSVFKWAGLKERKIGLRPWTADIIQGTTILTGGTLAAADFARYNSYAANIAGGRIMPTVRMGLDTALSMTLQLLRNMPFSITAFQGSDDDLDVHQGDGTASIFLDNPKILTLSVHETFPFRKQQSNVDISLEKRDWRHGIQIVLRYCVQKILSLGL